MNTMMPEQLHAAWEMQRQQQQHQQHPALTRARFICAQLGSTAAARILAPNAEQLAVAAIGHGLLFRWDAVGKGDHPIWCGSRQSSMSHAFATQFQGMKRERTPACHRMLCTCVRVLLCRTSQFADSVEDDVLLLLGDQPALAQA